MEYLHYLFKFKKIINRDISFKDILFKEFLVYNMYMFEFVPN